LNTQKIEYLRSLGFTWTRIAQLLGISRATLYRHLEREGIDITHPYTVISDYDLDDVLREIKRVHVNDGERLIIGHLRHRGIFVPRSRVRASIHRVDPISTAIRKSVTIRRRTYYVEGPNSVWHIDGHHKLIKWRFVVHGGIDGYSRTIVYLHCSTNNRASTVLSSFCDGVTSYGVPDRVRSDRGGENIDVWRYMLEQHQSGSSVIVGSSTHNERIERLWRDVNRCVSVLFANLFREMEYDGRLSVLNEVDMFCLHTVFLPRINHALNCFVESWNNHQISTEHNLSPNQMFIQGALMQNMTPTLPVPSFSASNIPIPASNELINVPRCMFTPCDMLLEQLDGVNLLMEADDFGYLLYRRVCGIVGDHICNCDICNCE
jgi:hypothetical protein